MRAGAAAPDFSSAEWRLCAVHAKGLRRKDLRQKKKKSDRYCVHLHGRGVGWSLAEDAPRVSSIREVWTSGQPRVGRPHSSPEG